MKRGSEIRAASWLLMFAPLLWMGIAHAQAYSIGLTGALERPLSIDAALMSKLPRQSIEASDHGKSASFQGVWLRDVLEHAGAPLGKKLRGKNMALCLRLSARDGYATVFALAELDPAFRDKPILLADHRDGKPLADDEGPLRLVVADEMRGGRWIRQITRIELMDLAP